MPYQPSDGKWELGARTDEIRNIREQVGEEEYGKLKASFKNLLCSYFNTGECNNEQGNTIRPVARSARGGKVLKVRFGIPGSGKSGGLRLVVVVYCDDLRVVITGAFQRRDDPSDNEMLATTEDY